MTESLLPTYQKLIASVYESRYERNKQYSMRAYARDLGLSVSQLLEVIKGVGGISSATANRIVDVLELSELDRDLFLASVDMQHSRSLKRRRVAEIKYQSICETKKNLHFIDHDRIAFISEWYHFAILELTKLQEYIGSVEWISEQLELDHSTVKQAVQRLIRLDMGTTNQHGEFIAFHSRLRTLSDIPSAAVRKAHINILELAAQKIETIPTDKKEFSTIFLPINSDNLVQAKTQLREFRRKFTIEHESVKQKDRIYCLAMQFFPLQKEKKECLN